MEQFLKTYHQYHEERRQSELKLQRVEQQHRARVEQENKKNAPSKRVRHYEKQTEKVSRYLSMTCPRVFAYMRAYVHACVHDFMCMLLHSSESSPAHSLYTSTLTVIPVACVFLPHL